MMKKFNKILIIIAIILVFLGATLLIFKQNKKDDNFKEESLINFNISNDIEHETSFISNNTYLVVVLKNNSNINIIKANLKVNFTSEEINEEVNMLTKDNKTVVLVKVPDSLVSNILNEKIKITLDVIKEGETNFIDVTSLNKDVKYTTSLNNEYININIDGNNTTSKDIKLLMGNIIMYKNNKIVEAKTFGIENIKSKSNFSKVVSLSNVNYDKIEVYYTFAY